MNRFACSLICICLCSTGEAEWIQRDSHLEPSTVAGIVHQHVVFENASRSGEATLDLARCSPQSCRIRLIDNPEGKRDLAAVMNAENAVAGINGGYFGENFAPLGLRISDGKIFAPLVRARLLSGVFTFSDGHARIARASEFSKRGRASVAVQCGPFLVERGRAVAGLESQRRARRTFVGVTTATEVILGSSSEVSLADLAGILAAGTGELKTQRALNLDGGSSTAFWFKAKDGTIVSISAQKPVRDYVAVLPK